VQRVIVFYKYSGIVIIINNVFANFLFADYDFRAIKKIMKYFLKNIFKLSINAYLCSPKIRERFGRNIADNI